MAGPSRQPLTLSPPELFAASHATRNFDCGAAALNHFLQRYALANQTNGSARSFVTQVNGEVFGYYSLAAASVEHAQVPARVGKGLARHPVPMLLLARLAVDMRAQGQGVGRSLLQSALAKYLQACDIIGCRALMVHAKDEAAARFYQGYGFEPSPIDVAHLYLLTKDIRKTLG
jgi:GNAT superfamily N-acetyltransferase